MLKIFYVGIGGFIGSAFRYMVSLYAAKLLGTQMPYGTLIVNFFGGIMIGFVMELSLSTNISPELRLFLTTGIFGGFTTFSAFSYETIHLFSAGSYLLGSINVILNVGLGLGGVLIGKMLAHIL